jgi:hypothetical protein
VSDLSRTWHGILAAEGATGDDGRHIERGALTLRRGSPLYVFGSQDVVGTIDRIWREGNLVHGEGIIFVDSYPADFEVPIALDVQGEWHDVLPGHLMRGTIVGAAIGGQSIWPEAVIKVGTAGV